MPEGAEIRSSANILNTWVQDDVLLEVDQTDIAGKFIKKPIKNLNKYTEYLGRRLQTVDAKGKLMWFKFDDDHYISCGFGMAAQWSTEKNKHTCFSLTFQNRGKIYFNDMRHFGNIEFLDKVAFATKLGNQGFDLLAANETQIPEIVEQLDEILGKSKNIIADDLMDQSIFSGVGNYVRAEALYEARIDPFRLSFSLSDTELVTLSLALSNVFKRSLKLKGASILTYKNSDDTLGEFTFKCYGRDTDDAGNKILTKKTKNDRTLYYCPSIIK